MLASHVGSVLDAAADIGSVLDAASAVLDAVVAVLDAAAKRSISALREAGFARRTEIAIRVGGLVALASALARRAPCSY